MLKLLWWHTLLYLSSLIDSALSRKLWNGLGHKQPVRKITRVSHSFRKNDITSLDVCSTSLISSFSFHALIKRKVWIWFYCNIIDQLKRVLRSDYAFPACILGVHLSMCSNFPVWHLVTVPMTKLHTSTFLLYGILGGRYGSGKGCSFIHLQR